MAKWFGNIGFASEIEDDYGVTTIDILSKPYYGEFNKNYRRLQGAVSVNDEVTINNEISILADPYAINNFHSIRYAEYMGTKWKATSVEVQYPRLIITLGGEYTNG